MIKQRNVIFIKRLLLCFCVLSILLGYRVNAYASELVTDGVEITYVTEKSEYADGEPIDATLKIINKNDFEVRSFSAVVSVPVDYVLDDNCEIPKSINLKAGEEQTYNVKFVSIDKAISTDELVEEDANAEKKALPLWLIIVLVIIGIAVVGGVIVLILKKKKGTSIVSMFLIGSILASTLSISLDVEAAEISRKRETVSNSITIDGNSTDLIVEIYYDYNEQAGFLAIDTSSYGYNYEDKSYSVLGKVDAVSGSLNSSSEYSEISIKITNDKGTIIYSNTMSATDNWSFSGVGLFPGRNKIEVTAKGNKNLVSEIYLNDMFGYNYYSIVDAEKDTDGDGLYDVIEEYLGTEVNNPDTDGDKLSDYQEVNELGTDPLKPDTDDNGVSDYDEDCDGDLLSNGFEYENGTSPIFEDSDFDGLNDNDEINKYKTDPIVPDTDGDGASDGWEVLNGFNPLVFNDSFEISYSSLQVSEATPVSASVELSVAGGQADVDSLSIEKVYTYDNPFISPSIAGYLGDAYEFTIDGSFDNAKMTFQYDKSLGTIGEDFQPRVYYFNEETKSFEELEDQTVSNGEIVVNTPHFSTYTVLNKVEVDRAWENTATKLDASKAMGAADIVFSIDCSASMAWSDKEDYRRQIVQYFIDNLRENYDYAAIQEFTKSSEFTCPLSEDITKVQNALDGLKVDNGVGANSGTDGARAVYDAIEKLKKGKGTYKYIFFFTDADDNYSEYTYEQVTKLAIDNGVEVYTVGIGIDQSDRLTKLAEETGGKAYFMKPGSSVASTFASAVQEILSKSTDTNGDGISDYYTELILNGELLLSNGSDELSGWDLNYDIDGKLTDDCDGDGLKNGAEIQIVSEGKKTYIKMTSNPLHSHSDGDGIDDYTEVKNGSDPLRWSVDKHLVDILVDNNSGYYYENFYSNYDSSLFQQGFTFVVGGIFGVWNKDELYRDLMLDYYNDYATIETLANEEVTQNKKLWTDYLASLLKGAKDYSKDSIEWYDNAKKIHKLWSYINGVTEKGQIDSNFTGQITSIIVKLNQVSEEATQMRFECNGLQYTQRLLAQADVEKYVTKSTNALNKLSTAVGWIGFGVDVADTINELAKVNANSDVFKDNIDELDYIIRNSKDDHAKDAAKMIRSQLAGNYGNILIGVIEDVAELGMKHIIKAAAKANIYVAAVVAVRDVTDILFGISDDIKQEYKMLCYHEMSSACAYYVKLNVSTNGVFYEISTTDIEDFQRYITHLAQLRILGERQFYEWEKYEGWLAFIGNWIIDIDSVQSNVNMNIRNIKLLSELLGLNLSSKMKYEV